MAQELLYEFSEDNGVVISVYKGSYGDADKDIIVKVKDSNVGDVKEKSIKHIYWAVDVYIKKAKNLELTNKLLKKVGDLWSSLPLLDNNKKETVEKWVNDNLSNVDLNEFSELNGYGFLPVNSLYNILVLLLVNERSEDPASHYFYRTILFRLIDDDPDIYDVLAWCTYTKKSPTDIKRDKKRD